MDVKKEVDGYFEATKAPSKAQRLKIQKANV